MIIISFSHSWRDGGAAAGDDDDDDADDGEGTW